MIKENDASILYTNIRRAFSNASISTDGMVIDGSGNISFNQAFEVDAWTQMVPYPIARARSVYLKDNSYLDDLKNFPHEVTDSYTISRCSISSLEGMSKIADSVTLSELAYLRTFEHIAHAQALS